MKKSDQTKTLATTTKPKRQYLHLTGLGAATMLATTLMYVVLASGKLPQYLGE